MSSANLLRVELQIGFGLLPFVEDEHSILGVHFFQLLVDVDAQLFEVDCCHGLDDLMHLHVLSYPHGLSTASNELYEWISPRHRDGNAGERSSDASAVHRSSTSIFAREQELTLSSSASYSIGHELAWLSMIDF